MWYRLAIVTDDLDMKIVNKYKSMLESVAQPRIKFRELARSIGDTSPEYAALIAAFQSINNESGNNPIPIPPGPKPSSSSAPNTTVTDLTLDKADELERLRPEDKSGDLIVRPTGGELDLYKPKKDDDDPKKPSKGDADCIIEEEVFIQNLLTGLTGYAQIYFKKKIFTISQDTYGGNRSRLAPVQTALGLTPPGRLDTNTQAYDPASATGSPLGNFKRDRASITDPFGNPTAVMPVKDKTVVWNTADVQSIMSSLEKIAQMPELQKYGAKEITNILRYPLLQVKNSAGSVDRQIADKGLQLNRYEPLLLRPDVPFGLTREDVVRIVDDLKREIFELKKAKEDEKPDVEVVPFKDFYKLTELSRYYIYEGSQLNKVFCKLETQLIKTLNNTLNTLGKMEKNKRLKEIYENARGKK